MNAAVTSSLFIYFFLHHFQQTKSCYVKSEVLCVRGVSIFHSTEYLEKGSLLF